MAVRSSGAAGANSNRLATCLPLNLRSFLSSELGDTLDSDAERLTAQALEAGNEEVLREVARAIRRFSASRSREPWAEFTISITSLESALRASKSPRQQAVLCLRCQRINVGPEARAPHRDAPCVSLELYCSTQSLSGEIADSMRELATRQGLYRVLEDFRSARASAGEPHYDLDYYLRGDEVVFTWRPLVDGAD